MIWNFSLWKPPPYALLANLARTLQWAFLSRYFRNRRSANESAFSSGPLEKLNLRRTTRRGTALWCHAFPTRNSLKSHTIR